MARSKEPRYYSRFRWMISVTQNPRHPYYFRYGAKGIGCVWHKSQYKEFESWLINNLGHQPSLRHQLCRINKLKDWQPNNMAWMTAKERSRSLTRHNVYASYGRKQKPLSQWAEELDIPFHSLRRRYAKGIPIKDIVKEFKNVKT